MSQQLTLSISNATDLALILSLAERLSIEVVDVQPTPDNSRAAQLEKMKAAAKDPLFLADVRGAMEDFQHSDDEL